MNSPLYQFTPVEGAGLNEHQEYTFRWSDTGYVWTEKLKDVYHEGGKIPGIDRLQWLKQVEAPQSEAVAFAEWLSKEGLLQGPDGLWRYVEEMLYTKNPDEVEELCLKQYFTEDLYRMFTATPSLSPESK